MNDEFKDVEISLKVSENYSSLSAISNDLKNIVLICDNALKLGDSFEDKISIDALGVAAVIKYNRCFHGGKRKSLSEEDLSNFSVEELECHQYFKAYRDKHMAHAINKYEHCQIRCSVRISDRGHEASNFSANFNQVCLSKANIQVIKQLANKVRLVVEEKKYLEEKCLKKHIASLSNDEINQLKPFKARQIKVGLEHVLPKKRVKA
ncbi:hypothetical protein QNE66_004125 [Vibrio vulnificus]|nr:hypothetical protein [Vibrio vulnificus]